MLRRIRILLAAVFFVSVTALFLDFTGCVHAWLGWTAKVQFLPALLALNLGVVTALVLLTLLVGRAYCSVICPLGVMQDIIAWMSRKGKGRKNRYSYSPAKSALRYGVLLLFVLALAGGVGSVAALLAPYSAYGRIAANLFAPLYRYGNNLLALVSEHFDSYAFYSTEVWMKGLSTFIIAVVTLLVIGFLAWKNGRTYCNTICPVGTLLGMLSRFSLLRPVIDTTRCNGCKLCARRCKAACINAAEHRIDYSRCVACMDCIDNCHQGAIRLQWRGRKQAPDTAAQPEQGGVDRGKRSFLTATGFLAAATTLKAQQKKVDGGLAVIEDKQKPARTTPVLPAGTWSAAHFAQHCTACQLCVSACPNGVLQPSSGLLTLMQPEMSFEHGYCRPECNRCSEICPAGAIRPITVADKLSTRIGHAVWVRKNCLPLTDGVACGNCARHCPTGAIQMIPSDKDNPESPKIPVVNTERCIGCGACEHLCPARPFSAIYVEGNEQHSEY